MSYAHHWRRSRVAAALGAGALATTVSVALLPAPAQAGTLPGTLAVTTPSNGKLAAGTGKQVVVLTVSGSGATALSEDNVSGVKLGSDAGCNNLQNYVVTNATTITVKTPSSGCPANGAEDVAILLNSGADEIKKTGGITFVPPPKVTATAATKPVINDNSSGFSDVTKQQQRFLSSGGQTLRVKAASDYAFDPRSAAALGATVGGKAGTEVKVYAADGTTLMNGATATDSSVAAQVGNFMTFRTASGMDDANDTLVVTQNGVSKSFLTADTGAAVVTGPAISALSTNSGKSSGGTVVTITGTNFNKDVTKYGTDVKVYFCGVEAAAYGTTTPVVAAVNSLGTSINVTTPAVAAVSAGLGTTTYAGTCSVTITEGSWTSPISGATAFAFLNE